MRALRRRPRDADGQGAGLRGGRLGGGGRQLVDPGLQGRHLIGQPGLVGRKRRDLRGKRGLLGLKPRGEVGQRKALVAERGHLVGERSLFALEHSDPVGEGGSFALERRDLVGEGGLFGLGRACRLRDFRSRRVDLAFASPRPRREGRCSRFQAWSPCPASPRHPRRPAGTRRVASASRRHPLAASRLALPGQPQRRCGPRPRRAGPCWPGWSGMSKCPGRRPRPVPPR